MSICIVYTYIDESSAPDVSQAPPPAPPTSFPTTVTVSRDSLCISIDRFPIQAPPPAQALPTPTLQPPPIKQKPHKQKKKIPPPIAAPPPPPPSFIDTPPADPLFVKLPRGKLRGYFGLPYSGAVYGIEDGVRQNVSQTSRLGTGLTTSEDRDYDEFAVVPGAAGVEEFSYGIWFGFIC